MSGLVCAGDVHIAILNSDDSFNGYIGVKNTTKLQITPGKAKELTRISKQYASYATPLDIVEIPGIAAIALDIDDNDSDTVKLAFLGTNTAVAVTGTSVTSEAFTAHAGLWAPLQHTSIAQTPAPVVKTTASTPVTLVYGTDYLVDYNAGLIYAIPTGAITDMEALTVGYTYGAEAGNRVDAAQVTQLNCRIQLEGRNLVNGNRIRVIVPKAILTPTGNQDFLGENFLVTQLAGSIALAAGQTAPYSVINLN